MSLTEGGGLTREPLLDQRVDVVRDEGHGGEISRLRVADDLNAAALLPLPVDVGRLHAEETHTRLSPPQPEPEPSGWSNRVCV